MANDTFDFSMNLSPRQPGGGESSRYLSLPFEAHPIHDGQALLMVAGQAATQCLPMQLARVLSCCNRLRTLDEHAQQAATRLGVPTHETGALRQAVLELTERGLLVSESRIGDLLASQQAGGDDGNEESIETLFVRTCARADALGRLLESLARAPMDAAPKRCVILDDSHTQADRQATRKVVETLRAAIDIDLHLIDDARRTKLLAAIAAGAGCDAAALNWFLEGDEDEETPTYGAGPNLALLLAAGSRLTLMDDDATLEAWTPNEAVDHPIFLDAPDERLWLPAPGAELPGPGFTPLQEHPLAHHARYLGRRVGDLLGAGGSGEPGALDALSPNLLHRLSKQPRAKITSSGVCGDPGTEDLHWLYAGSPEALAKLCSNEDAYRAAVFQRRVARCTERAAATPNFALMTTTLTGIDNRELLLPTAARGRNEDLLHGALTAYLYPGSMQVALPQVLYHMRPQPRCWNSADLDRPRRPGLGRYLCAWVEDLAGHCHSSDTRSRIDVLTAGLRDLARRDRASLEADVGRLMTELRSRLVEKIEASSERLNPPDWMKADFRRAIESSAHVPPGEAAELKRVAASTQRFAAGYADRLPDWCLAWRYCRESGFDRLLEMTE